jgi:hypothetical protein
VRMWRMSAASAILRWKERLGGGGWVMVCAIPGAMSECGVRMQR